MSKGVTQKVPKRVRGEPTDQINFRMARRILDRLDDVCEQFGLTRGEIIGQIVDSKLDNFVAAENAKRHILHRVEG